MDRRRALMSASGGSKPSGKVVNTITISIVEGDIGNVVYFDCQYPVTSNVEIWLMSDIMEDYFGIAKGETSGSRVDCIIGGNIRLTGYLPAEDDTYIYNVIIV